MKDIAHMHYMMRGLIAPDTAYVCGALGRNRAQGTKICFDALIESFCDLILPFFSCEVLFFAGITDEANLGQDARHVQIDENDKRGFLDTAVAKDGVMAFYL
jgi:hypothetical protein